MGIAMKEAQKELDAEYEEFDDEVTQTQSINDETEYIKSNLTQIQKYAYRYLEEVAKIIDEDHLEELHGMVEVGAEKWKRDTLKRIKETENAMENNERLYYEARELPPLELAKSYMVEQMKVYGPPSPPPPLSTENSSSPTLSTIPENHLYIHPMDYDPPQFL